MFSRNNVHRLGITKLGHLAAHIRCLRIIDRRRFKIGMPQKNLDRLQIGTALQKMSCPAVAQGVRRDSLLDAGTPRRFADGIPDGLVRDRLVGPWPQQAWE